MENDGTLIVYDWGDEVYSISNKWFVGRVCGRYKLFSSGEWFTVVEGRSGNIFCQAAKELRPIKKLQELARSR